jgi:phosphatidylglycerophosphate synthase
MGVVLWQRGDLGVWIVSAGVLRYAYVLCLALVPARRGELPRSQFGRYAFSLLVLGLITAFALPRPLATAAALAGTLAALISFARGFYYSYSHGAGAGVTTEAALRH